MRTPDRRWDLAPEVHRLVGDWARMPQPPDVAALEEAIREAYRAAGLRPGPVIWCRTPGEDLAVLESPVAHSRLLLAHRHPLVRLRRWRPIGIGAVGQIVVAMVLAVVLMVLALTTWIAATVLSYRLVRAVLGIGIGQSSPVESDVFLACLAGWFLVLWRALPSAISLARRAWTAVARRAWHAEVPWVGELRRPRLASSRTVTI